MRRPRFGKLVLPPLIAAVAAAGCGGSPPSVVLISIDTLRADHLGIYGYEENTSPHIDSYFGDGTVFDNATSTAPCTVPAVRQFLEGAFVPDPERLNLPELLRAKSYATAAVVSQQQFYRRGEDYSRGFEHFDIQSREAVDRHGMSTRTAEEVTQRALDWLDARTDNAPFFLWLHYFDPHDPYDPPVGSQSGGGAAAAKRWSDPRGDLLQGRESVSPGACRDMPSDRFDAEAWVGYTARYDAEIRYVDAQLGRLFAYLQASGLDSESIVLLLSDHGESLGEDQHWNHCLTVRDREIRVPFLLRVRSAPLRGANRVADPVSTLDALPTLIRLVDADFPTGGYDGIDLRHPIPDRVVASLWSGRVAVRDRDWKLIYEQGVPSRLYNTARDAAERWNQIHDHEDVAKQLAKRGEHYVALRESINAEKIERALRRIGYIQ